jgi:predicted kinase
VAEHLQRGQSVIYDETNFLRAQRDRLRAIAASCGVSTYVLYVTTPESEVRRRWQANRADPQRGDVRDDDFALVVAQFEPPTDDELLICYDTSLAIEPWIKATFD